MKKMILVLFLAVLSIPIFAQDVPIPTDAADVYLRFQFWTGAFFPLIGLTVFLTQTVITLFRVVSGTLKQVISWGIGPILVVALNLLNIGIAKDLLWYGVIAYSVAVSLGANRAFDVGVLDSLLKMFKFYKRPESVK